jgi:hypothetical protein
VDVLQAKGHNIRFYEEFCDILKCAIFSNTSILKRADLGREGLVVQCESYYQSILIPWTISKISSHISNTFCPFDVSFLLK